MMALYRKCVFVNWLAQYKARMNTTDTVQLSKAPQKKLFIVSHISNQYFYQEIGILTCYNITLHDLRQCKNITFKLFKAISGVFIHRHADHNGQV